MEYKFLVNKCFVDVYEDSYEEGELDLEKNYYISFDRPCTLDELMRKLSSYGFSDDPSDYMWWNENKYSELMTDALLCEDNTEPSKRELEDWKNDLKRISRKYKNSYDTFLMFSEDFIFYGTWDEVYYMYRPIGKNKVRTRSYGSGFSDFSVNETEISESGGIYIITENTELVKQVDYLMKN